MMSQAPCVNLLSTTINSATKMRAKRPPVSLLPHVRWRSDVAASIDLDGWDSRLANHGQKGYHNRPADQDGSCSQPAVLSTAREVFEPLGLDKGLVQHVGDQHEDLIRISQLPEAD
jgi:hypothetical protein